MLNDLAAEKAPIKRHAWLWNGVVWPGTVALLVLGVIGTSLGMTTLVRAHDAAPQPPDIVSVQTAVSTPAIVRLSSTTAYVGWTGRDTAHHLNLMTYDASTQAFGPAITFTDTSLAGSGPSLAFFPSNAPSNLYVAWRGGDNRLNVGRFNPSDPTHLAGKVTLNQYSFNAPSLTAFSGRLYLSWRGTDGRLNILSSADGSVFNTQEIYSIAILTSPTLVATPFFLEMAWEEPSSPSNQSFIVIAQYNQVDPRTLSAIVSTNQVSSLPVALDFAGVAGYPALVVAWRTPTDAHIQFGFFNGTPDVTGIVNSGETTPYGPSLSRNLYSWTGTDPAQHVNVSTESL